jgi:hypothetical protein
LLATSHAATGIHNRHLALVSCDHAAATRLLAAAATAYSAAQQLQLLSILPYVINTLATANSTAYGQQVLPYAFSSLAMACPFDYRQQYLINALATVNPVAYVPYALNTLAAVNPVIFNELATTNPVIFNALATTNPTIFNALATANPVIFRQQFFTGDA